ncbi:hypothetical protein [Sphingobacterium suaedae]|uniref:Uncharacterized protein n=1 Tax=Sphingobacterium suaedae TaxID=1686402 RepID=A0ABW5KNH0_9SPHI
MKFLHIDEEWLVHAALIEYAIHQLLLRIVQNHRATFVSISGKARHLYGASKDGLRVIFDNPRKIGG